MSQKFLPVLLVLIAVSFTVGCQNAIPTVTQLESVRQLPRIAAKDPKNFAQFNAASSREVLPGSYKGTVRISQPLADIKAVSNMGDTLVGTVTLAK